MIYGYEEGENKEKTYKNIIKNKGLFNPKESNFFKFNAGNDGNFTCLGLSETSIAQFEPLMINKLKEMARYISVDLSEEYNVDDLVVAIPVHSQ